MAETMTTIPIASLNPDQDPEHGYVRAIVTLLWPYSMSTRQMSMLLAEPDFRLRRKRGQVVVQISGVCAQELARTHVGIGDEVLLSLEGGSWREPTNLSVQTPGRSVESELYFGRQLDLQLTRDSEPFAHVRVEDTADENISRSSSPDISTMATPARLYAGDLRGDRVHTPVFHKRARLSSGSLVDSPYDPFAAEESEIDVRDRKRARRSWGSATKWRLTRETSPRGSPLAAYTGDLDGFMDVDDSPARIETTAEVVKEVNVNANVVPIENNDTIAESQTALPTPTRKTVQAQRQADERFNVSVEPSNGPSEASKPESRLPMLQPAIVDEIPSAQDDLYREATPPDLRASTSSQKHVRFSMGKPEVFESSPRTVGTQSSGSDVEERDSPEVESPEEESDEELMCTDDFEIEEVEGVEESMAHSRTTGDGRDQRPSTATMPILAPPPPSLRNEMPPPPLPTIRTTDLDTDTAGTKDSISGSPRTPDLQPVLSASLPLPSPFPGDDLTNPYLVAPITPRAAPATVVTTLRTPTRNIDFSSPNQTSPAGIVPDWMFQFGFGAETEESPERDVEMGTAPVELEAPLADIEDDPMGPGKLDLQTEAVSQEDDETSALPEDLSLQHVSAAIPDTEDVEMSDLPTQVLEPSAAGSRPDELMDADEDHAQGSLLEFSSPPAPEKVQLGDIDSEPQPRARVETEEGATLMPESEIEAELPIVSVVPPTIENTVSSEAVLPIDASQTESNSPANALASGAPIVIDLLGSSSDVEEGSDSDSDDEQDNDEMQEPGVDEVESEGSERESETEYMDNGLIYGKDLIRLPSSDPFEERSDDDDEDGEEQEIDKDEDEEMGDSSGEDDDGDEETARSDPDDGTYKPSDNQVIDPSLSVNSAATELEAIDIPGEAPEFSALDAESSAQSMLRTEVDTSDVLVAAPDYQQTSKSILQPDQIADYEAAAPIDDDDSGLQSQTLPTADEIMPTRSAIYDEIDEAIGDVPRRRRHDRTPSIASSSRPSTATSPRFPFGVDGAVLSTPRIRRRSRADTDDDIHIYEDETATPPAKYRAVPDSLEGMTGEPLSTQAVPSAPPSVTIDSFEGQMNMGDVAAHEELLPLMIRDTDESYIDEDTHIHATVVPEDSNDVRYPELPIDRDINIDEAASGTASSQAARSSDDDQKLFAPAASRTALDTEEQALPYNPQFRVADGMDMDRDDDYVRVASPVQANSSHVVPVEEAVSVFDIAPPTPEPTQRDHTVQGFQHQESIQSISVLPPTPQMTQSDMAGSFASKIDAVVDHEPPSFPDSAINAIADPDGFYVYEDMDQPMTDPINATHCEEEGLQREPEPETVGATSEARVSPSKSIFAKTKDLSSRLGNWFSPRKSKRGTTATDIEPSNQPKAAPHAVVNEDEDLHSDAISAPDLSPFRSSAKQSSIIPQLEASASQEELAFNDRVLEHMRASQSSQAPLTSNNPPSSQGLRTSTSYYTPLASLPSKINTDSPFDTHIDCLAVVSKKTSAQKRADKGPKDYYTILRVVDRSMHHETELSHSLSSVQVQIFRPWIAALPRAEVGDVILLRNFQVNSQPLFSSAKSSHLTSSQPADPGITLRSTETSSWCVWRFAHHAHETASRRTRSHDKEGSFSAHEGKAIWELEGQQRDAAVVRIEETNGPPVEFGAEERDVVVGLAGWWSGIVADDD